MVFLRGRVFTIKTTGGGAKKFPEGDFLSQQALLFLNTTPTR